MTCYKTLTLQKISQWIILEISQWQNMIFLINKRNTFKQNLGNLFTNERTLHFISRIKDSRVCTDSIANMFVSCLCEASTQLKQNVNQMSLGLTKRVYPWRETCIYFCKSLELHIRMKIVTRIYEPEIVSNRHAAKKTDYRAMKLDDLISSVNDQKSFWSKLKKKDR